MKNYYEINRETAERMLKKREKNKQDTPRGQYFYKVENWYITIDNRTHDFFMEWFKNREKAIERLKE